MAIYYDENVFAKYQALAISDASQFVEGKTYYSNTYPEEFVFLGLETNNEHYRSKDLEYSGTYGEVVAWIKAEYQLDCVGTVTDGFSLTDRNIGAHYNPWLFFEDKATVEACRKELVVTYEADEDNFDDWYDPIDYDEGYADDPYYA